MKKLIVLLLLFCLFVSSTAARISDKPLLGRQLDWSKAYGLVGYWLFNEGSGNKIYDLSGNGDDGVVADGSPTWVYSSRYGHALRFDGDDNFDITNSSPSLSGMASLSIEILLNWDGTDTDENTVFGAGNSCYRIRLEDAATGAGRAWIYLNADDGAGLWLCTWAATANTWHHIVFTYSVAGVDLYVDGNWQEEDGSPPCAGTIDSVTGDTFYIGSNTGASEWFNGDIAKIAVYDCVLTASEIARLYREPFYVFEPSWNWSLYAAIAAPPVGNIPIFMYHYMNH